MQLKVLLPLLPGLRLPALTHHRYRIAFPSSLCTNDPKSASGCLGCSERDNTINDYSFFRSTMSFAYMICVNTDECKILLQNMHLYGTQTDRCISSWPQMPCENDSGPVQMSSWVIGKVSLCP